jgi:hypothetical protein
MDIEFKQTRVLIWKIFLFLNIISLYIEAIVPLFHKPLKTSSIKFFGLLSEPDSDFPFHRYHDEGHDMLERILRIGGVARSALQIPTAVNFNFLDPEPLLFHSNSSSIILTRGWVDPVPDPLLLRKSGSAENWIMDLRICSQKLWPLDHGRGPSVHIEK